MGEIQRDEELPGEVVEGVRAAYRGEVRGDWGARDRVVVGAFGGRRRWRWGWAVGVAACLGVAIGGGVWWESGRGSVRTGDIRDAFYVARAVEAGKRLDKGWDVNGDGRVDEGDVRVLAMAAVKVGL